MRECFVLVVEETEEVLMTKITDLEKYEVPIFPYLPKTKLLKFVEAK